MKNLHMEYALSLHFDQEVQHHFFTLKCLPSNEARQKVKKIRIALDHDFYSFSDDCFHNHMLYGHKEGLHQELLLRLEADVEVDWTKYEQDTRLNPVFLLPTSFTRVEDELQNFYEQCVLLCKDCENDLEKGMRVMHQIHDVMRYEKGITDVSTSAKEAFALKKGVCQDYAQIMIAVLRKMGIPSRYVSGVMLNETSTHAWIELFSKDRWYGFDPTNDMLVNDIYITFARGRDHSDTLVNKGLFFGPNVKQQQDITIHVEERWI